MYALVPTSRDLLLKLRAELTQEIADLELIRDTAPWLVNGAMLDRLNDDYRRLSLVDQALALLPAEPLPYPVPVPTPTPTPLPTEPTGGLLGPVIDYLRSMWSSITSDLGGQLWDARRIILSSISPLTGTSLAMWDVLNPIGGSLYRRLDQALAGRLPDDLFQLGSGLSRLDDTLKTFLTEGIGRTISGAQEGIAGLLGQGLEDFFRRSGGLVGTALGAGATAFLEELEKAFPAIGGPLFTMLRDLPNIPPEVQGLFQEASAPTTQIGALLQQAATTSAISGTVGNAMGTLLAPVTFALNRRFTFTHLDDATAIRALFRFPKLRPTLESDLSDLGWSTSRREILESMSRPRPSTGDLQALTNRAIISPLAAVEELELQGWPSDYARHLISLRRVFPGPSDIVRFAVREAFSPEVVRRFGQDEDFPSDAIPLAARVGLEAEDLRLYWRAHWELPSATAGYEMLHRNVIDLATLNLLLRTQDVMPFWRDKLVAIAYTPYTRVDIRRFYRQRILSRADVVRAYLDIGYEPAKAEVQALFVEAEDKDIAFNRALPEIRQQAKLGLLEGPTLTSRVAALAPDPASAAEALELLALDIRGDRFGQLLSAYRQALRAHRITEAAFTTQLTALGISKTLIAHYIRVEAVLRPEGADAREDSALRAIGSATVVRRFREGLITDVTFDTEMASLGYSQAQTDRYRDIARLEFDTNYRLDLVAAALTTFRKDKLTKDQLATRLKALAIAPTLVDAYIQREIARGPATDPDADQAALRASGQSVVIRRYREGWIPASQFSKEMASLGYSQASIDRYRLIADLEFDYDWRQDSLDNLRVGFRKAVIDADRFLASLAQLGMDPTRAQTHLAREVMAKGILPPG